MDAHALTLPPEREKCSPETWLKYQEYRDKLGSTDTLTIGLRDEIFFAYRYLAKAAATRYAAHCMPYRSLIEPDDIHRDAELGLLEAIGSYDLSRGAVFSTHAYRRINGSIIDGIRSLQHFPRIISKIRRELAPILQKLSHELSKQATIDDIAERYPDIMIEDIPIIRITSDMLVSVNVYNQSSEQGGSEKDEDDSTEQPFAEDRVIQYNSGFDRVAFIDTIEKILKLLEEDQHEQRVIYCYFFLGMTSTAISKMANLSPTWISEKKVTGLQKIRRECRNNPEFAAELLSK